MAVEVLFPNGLATARSSLIPSSVPRFKVASGASSGLDYRRAQ
jgi:hypothetical protein